MEETLEAKLTRAESEIASLTSRVSTLESKPDSSDSVVALERRFNELTSQLASKVHGVFVPAVIPEPAAKS